MTGKTQISDTDLHAFLDGALDAARSGEIAAAIDADPVLAGRFALYRADKAILKQVYAPLANRPVPPEWIALARGKVASAPAVKPRSARPWRAAMAIAAVIVVAIVGASVYWRQQPFRASEIVQAALDARSHPAAGERTIAVADGADGRQYDAVLDTTVALNVRVPSLARMGYRLAGLHLYPGLHGGAAELLYRDGSNRLFTLYLRHSDGAARFDQFERGGLRVCVWQDDQVGTVMTGNVSTAAMQRLASLAYTGLTL